MRKRRILIAGLVPVVLALGACSGGSADDTSSSGSGKVQLSYWLWDANQQPGYEQCATDFTAANPDITIKFQQYAWDDYWTKLTASFVGNSAPDVFTDHLSKYADFAGQKQIVPLDDLIAKDGFDTSVFAPGLVDPWKFTDGKTYGIPKDWDTTAFFYNADMIKDAGYTEDDLAGLTWNPDDGGTFEKLVAHLTVDKNGVRGDEAGFDKSAVAVYGIGINPEYDVTGQMQWANFTGSLPFDALDKNPWGTHYNLDDPDVPEDHRVVLRPVGQGLHAQERRVHRRDAGADRLQEGRDRHQRRLGEQPVLRPRRSQDRRLRRTGRPERQAGVHLQRPRGLDQRGLQAPGRGLEVGPVPRVDRLPGRHRRGGHRLPRDPVVHGEGHADLRRQGMARRRPSTATSRRTATRSCRRSRRRPARSATSSRPPCRRSTSASSPRRP